MPIAAQIEIAFIVHIEIKIYVIFENKIVIKLFNEVHFVYMING